MAEGQVMTVLGPIRPEALGMTLIHEHLLCDLTAPAARGLGTPEVEITLANVFEVNYRPGAYPGNHHLQDAVVAAQEARLFAEAGGGTIVEVTTGGLLPDPEGLAGIARQSGVNIIMGAGFYTAAYLDADTQALSREAMAEIIIAQLREGTWGSRIRCGIIGEIGCSWPLVPVERRALQAAADAQRRTGAAITVHPGRHPAAPHEILDVLQAAGADISRVIIDHMDRTYEDDGEVVALARRGCVVEFDFFGIEMSNYWMGMADLPSDWMRLRCIRRLFEAGLGDRVTLSHDICTRSRLQHYGGHGYGHLLRNVVPLMRDRQFTEAEIATLLVETPRRLLTMLG
ncbi:phosphotriesterase family protein [Roseomonas sp. WA12]